MNRIRVQRSRHPEKMDIQLNHKDSRGWGFVWKRCDLKTQDRRGFLWEKLSLEEDLYFSAPVIQEYYKIMQY